MFCKRCFNAGKPVIQCKTPIFLQSTLGLMMCCLICQTLLDNLEMPQDFLEVLRRIFMLTWIVSSQGLPTFEPLKPMSHRDELCLVVLSEFSQSSVDFFQATFNAR